MMNTFSEVGRNFVGVGTVGAAAGYRPHRGLQNKVLRDASPTPLSSSTPPEPPCIWGPGGESSPEGVGGLAGAGAPRPIRLPSPSPAVVRDAPMRLLGMLRCIRPSILLFIRRHHGSTGYGSAKQVYILLYNEACNEEIGRLRRHPYHREGLTAHFVDHFDDIYRLAFGDMAKLKCYCPEPACRRSGKQPFKADTPRDLVDQIWTHATSLTETSLDNGGCVHWRLLRKDEEEAHIIEFVNKNAFTDDDEASRTGFTAHPIGQTCNEARRGRSAKVQAHLVGDPRWVWRERRLDVKLTDTIEDIKKMLQKEEGVAEGQQTMFFGVKEDKDKIPLPEGTSMKHIAERNKLLPPYGLVGTVTVEVAAPRKSRTQPSAVTTLMPPPPQPGAGWFLCRTPQAGDAAERGFIPFPVAMKAEAKEEEEEAKKEEGSDSQNESQMSADIFEEIIEEVTVRFNTEAKKEEESLLYDSQMPEYGRRVKAKRGGQRVQTEDAVEATPTSAAGAWPRGVE